MTQAASTEAAGQTPGELSALFDEIEATFRVPQVPPLLRALADHPDYLRAAWAALKPNVQTLFFERRSDTVRRAAVEAAVVFGGPPLADDKARPMLTLLHYAAPKFFLAGAALRSATLGSQPKMVHVAPEETRRIVSGVPEGVASMNESTGKDEETRAVLEDIKRSTGQEPLGLEFRALAAWPEYLESAWSAIKPALTGPEYRQAQRSLRMLAERAITALPFRMDLGSHTLRHTGLSEAEIDEVRGILNRGYSADTATLINTAYLATGLAGRESALESPFPTDPK